MSTRSLICKELPDGQYYGVYCHSDGYLTFNGAMLIDHYSDSEKVDELLSFGDMSCLGKKIHPDPSIPHAFDFDKRQADVCVFYGRDRGETGIDARIISLEDAQDSWCEYMYIFGQDGVWRYYDLTLGEETCLCDVREDLDEQYRIMGIKRPNDYYGFWSQEAIEEEKAYQEIMDSYDYDLTPQENISNKVQKEIGEFKENILRKSPVEIYNEAGRVHFFEYMSDYLQYTELDDEQCKILYEGNNNILEALWDKMIELDDFNIGNEDDADFLIDALISECKTRSEQM